MFILIGYLALHAGLTAKLFDAARKWLGFLPGGLAVASVFSTAGFAAVSGASTATAAVFSRVAIPEMLSSGYSQRMATGVVAAGGTLASLIPPSAILVIYAIIVEQSVGKILVAGFIPGLVSAAIYAGVVMIWARMSPTDAPPPAPTGGWGVRLRALPGIAPIFAVMVIIFSAIYQGWATPTEAGALGAFVMLVVAVMNRTPVARFSDAMMETARLTAMIFALIWGVLIFVRFLGFSGLSDLITGAIVGLPFPPIVIMICILLAYVVLGMFMDAIGMLLLTLPIVYPAVIALGYDPIWFGIIVVKMAELCLITPPIGLNCFVVAGVRRDIPLATIFRGVLPFVVADVVTVALFLAFPAIITWLPNQMWD